MSAKYRPAKHKTALRDRAKLASRKKRTTHVPLGTNHLVVADCARIDYLIGVTPELPAVEVPEVVAPVVVLVSEKEEKRRAAREEASLRAIWADVISEQHRA